MTNTPTDAELQQTWDATLKRLRTTERKMRSMEFIRALNRLPDNQQIMIILERSRCSTTIIQMENQTLASIRDQLVAHEDTLKASTKKLKKKLQRLRRVEAVVTALGTVLNTVAKLFV